MNESKFNESVEEVNEMDLEFLDLLVEKEEYLFDKYGEGNYMCPFYSLFTTLYMINKDKGWTKEELLRDLNELGEICNTTTATFYTVLDYLEGSVLSSQGVYPSKTMMKCDNCGQGSLDTLYKYCPNCGRKFIDD